MVRHRRRRDVIPEDRSIERLWQVACGQPANAAGLDEPHGNAVRRRATAHAERCRP
jgi:hypothetical protein